MPLSEELFNDEFPDSALGTQPGPAAPAGRWPPRRWAAREGRAGTPWWRALLEEGWQP